MHSDLLQYSTKDLLELTNERAERDLAFEALQAVFKRWRDGIDVPLLIDFLESEVASDRLRGAYFLTEVSPRTVGMRDAVMKLANDDLALCRRAFVAYQISSDWYDDAVAEGLVSAIRDFDLRVRIQAIDWAIAATEERFEDFSRRVIADVSEHPSDTWPGRLRKSATRALEIAGRIRSGESVASIRTAVVEEDGFTFEHLDVFEWRYNRLAERRRKNRASKPRLADLTAFLDKHSDQEIRDAIQSENFSHLLHLPTRLRRSLVEHPDLWTDIWWYVEIRGKAQLADFPCVHLAFATSSKGNQIIHRAHGMFSIKSNEDESEGIVIAYCPWCAKGLNVGVTEPN